MLFHFRDKFPRLNAYWDKYLEFQERLELPVKTVLLQEGKKADYYYFIERGCIRAALNKNGEDLTVQFFFENEGLTSFESFLNETPSLFRLETIEATVVYRLSRFYVNKLLDELRHDPEFFEIILKISAERQSHYMNEFVSFIRDTPEQRYLNLLTLRPHIIQRVAQHYIASYLGISRVHLSRIKAGLLRRKP